MSNTRENSGSGITVDCLGESSGVFGGSILRILGAFFINTQLQLGEKEASGGPLNRFNGLLTIRLKLLRQFAVAPASGTSLK